MSRSRTVVQSATLLAGAMLLSGCAMMAAPEPDLASRNQALMRWANCVERVTGVQRGSINTIYRHVDTHCEGHRRDVAATFPSHLENQVAKRLSQRVTELASSRPVSATSIEAWADPQGTHFDTFKVRLNEARQGDL